jgi:hypothetical protein
MIKIESTRAKEILMLKDLKVGQYARVIKNNHTVIAVRDRTNDIIQYLSLHTGLGGFTPECECELLSDRRIIIFTDNNGKSEKEY